MFKKTREFCAAMFDLFCLPVHEEVVTEPVDDNFRDSDEHAIGWLELSEDDGNYYLGPLHEFEMRYGMYYEDDD